jgi:hypothetical protein
VIQRNQSQKEGRSMSKSSKRAPQVRLPFKDRRQVRVGFTAEPISSDGGALLLAQVDRQLGLLDGIAAAIRDPRDARYVQQPLVDLLRQRVFQIACGYEDCNDATQLRHDPILQVCCGRDPAAAAPLASQPTLSRVENAITRRDCYQVAAVLLQSYIARQPRRLRRLTLDLDTTDDRTYGQQELAFFSAFYGGYCYLPFPIFDQDGELITVVLLPGGGRPKVATVVSIVQRIVARLRARWPKLQLLIRADAHFAGAAMYQYCHATGCDFLIGLQPNKRLKPAAAAVLARAQAAFERTGTFARRFTSITYKARRGWPRAYRVLIKAEVGPKGTNVRFVITTLRGRAGDLYHQYCQRAEASENSIKDLKNALQADRLSCHRFVANQFRLLLHAAAYVLMSELRRHAAGTTLEHAQMDTLRLRLLKIGAQVQATARWIWVQFSASWPWQEVWHRIALRLC